MRIFKQINWKQIRLRNISVKALTMRRRMKIIRCDEKVDCEVDTLEKGEKEFSHREQSYKWLRRATKKDLIYNGSFHEAVAPVLFLGQLFAIMPVQGITSKNVADMAFQWFSFKTAYGLFIFSGICFYIYSAIRFFSMSNFILVAFDPVIFYGSVLCVFVIFTNLAAKWPKLMYRWREVEMKLPKYRSELRKGYMAHKFKMIIMVVLVCSMIEHLLNILVGIQSTNYCNPDGFVFENFAKIHMYHIFTIMDYSETKAILGKFINVVGTFIWSYMDIFVMVISGGLSDKFRQINENMIRFKGKEVPEQFWREHRAHYRSICDLCEEVDDAISGITMVSFSNNLYFICVQLMKTFNPEPSIAHKIYFWFSMMFLFCRTMAVSIFTSAINDESKKPVQIFRCVPKDSWCLEVKRFSQEVNSETVALTGMKFFHLTRGLLCSVAGAIVTYELVLFQFNVEIGVVQGCNG